MLYRILRCSCPFKLINILWFPVVPDSLEIEAPSQVKVGDIISVTCTANNSNPASDVSLIIDGVTPSGISSRHVDGQNGGTTTITVLNNYEIRPMDSDLTIKCYAFNKALRKTKFSTKNVIVLSKYFCVFLFTLNYVVEMVYNFFKLLNTIFLISFRSRLIFKNLFYRTTSTT